MQIVHKNIKIELKFEADGRFSGYGSKFNVVDNQRDIVLPGAFAKSIKDRTTEIKLLWQHRQDEPIGVFDEIREDTIGLFVSGRIMLDVQKGKEAYSLLKNGAINGLSIGYSPIQYTIDADTGTRILKEVELWEVSVVTFPANEHATVTAVKASDDIQTVRQFEEFLQKNGYSDREAVLIASKGFVAARDARDSRSNKDDAGDPRDLEGLMAALKSRGNAIPTNKH